MNSLLVVMSSILPFDHVVSQKKTIIQNKIPREYVKKSLLPLGSNEFNTYDDANKNDFSYI